MKNVFKWIRVLLAAGALQSVSRADHSTSETVFGDVTKRLAPPVVEPLSTDLPIHEMRAGFVKPPSSANDEITTRLYNEPFYISQRETSIGPSPISGASQLPCSSAHALLGLGLSGFHCHFRQAGKQRLGSFVMPLGASDRPVRRLRPA